MLTFTGFKECRLASGVLKTQSCGTKRNEILYRFEIFSKYCFKQPMNRPRQYTDSQVYDQIMQKHTDDSIAQIDTMKSDPEETLSDMENDEL